MPNRSALNDLVESKLLRAQLKGVKDPMARTSIERAIGFLERRAGTKLNKRRRKRPGGVTGAGFRLDRVG